MLISTLFTLLRLDSIFNKGVVNSFTRGDGVVLLLFFLVFYYLITTARNKVDKYDTEILTMSKSIIFTIIGLAGIVLGSNIFDIAMVIGQHM